MIPETGSGGDLGMNRVDVLSQQLDDQLVPAELLLLASRRMQHLLSWPNSQGLHTLECPRALTMDGILVSGRYNGFSSWGKPTACLQRSASLLACRQQQHRCPNSTKLAGLMHRPSTPTLVHCKSVRKEGKSPSFPFPGALLTGSHVPLPVSHLQPCPAACPLRLAQYSKAVSAKQPASF